MFSSKESACNAGATEARSPVQSLGQEDPLEKGMATHFIILENPMVKGTWWAIVHKVAKGQTRLKQLSMHAHATYYI